MTTLATAHTYRRLIESVAYVNKNIENKMEIVLSFSYMYTRICIELILYLIKINSAYLDDHFSITLFLAKTKKKINFLTVCQFFDKQFSFFMIKAPCEIIFVFYL